MIYVVLVNPPPRPLPQLAAFFPCLIKSLAVKREKFQTDFAVNLSINKEQQKVVISQGNLPRQVRQRKVRRKRAEGGEERGQKEEKQEQKKETRIPQRIEMEKFN